MSDASANRSPRAMPPKPVEYIIDNERPDQLPPWRPKEPKDGRPPPRVIVAYANAKGRRK